MAYHHHIYNVGKEMSVKSDVTKHKASCEKDEACSNESPWNIWHQQQQASCSCSEDTLVIQLCQNETLKIPVLNSDLHIFFDEPDVCPRVFRCLRNYTDDDLMTLFTRSLEAYCKNLSCDEVDFAWGALTLHGFCQTEEWNWRLKVGTMSDLSCVPFLLPIITDVCRSAICGVLSCGSSSRSVRVLVF